MQKILLIVSLLFVAGFASITSYDHMNSLWEAWKTQHGKSYSELEEKARYGIFVHNYKKIQKFNQENEDVKLAINKFADLTASEFKSQYSNCARPETNPEVIRERTVRFAPRDLPASVDWRSKGAVTPVKNQGQCGSCWAFSTTGVLESFYFINNGQLLSFSEQQLVDCDTQINQGCGGGYPDVAVQYVIVEGLEQESDYPYTAQNGTCQYNSSKVIKNITNDYFYVTPNKTSDLKEALVVQPVSVLVEADQDVFQFYSSGVIKTGCGANLDHAVLAVGYLKVGVINAFIVKNSWGTDWGMDGYVQIWDTDNANINDGQGVCGILAQPMVPAFDN